MQAVIPGVMPLPIDAVNQDDEEYGRILPLAEFLEKIRNRSDIFMIDKESRLSKIEVVAFAMAIIVCVCMGFLEKNVAPTVIPVASNVHANANVTFSREPVQIPNKINSKPISKNQLPKKTFKPFVKHSSGKPSGGAGIPSARIARMKAFNSINARLSAILSPGTSTSTSLVGITKGMDVALSGVHNLKQGGGNSDGRKMLEGIGTQTGYGISGFNGGKGDEMGDPLADLVDASGTAVTLRPMRHDRNLDNMNNITTRATSGVVIGGRTKMSIMRTVMENLSAVRYTYNKWLNAHPGATGKITVKFAIDEFGHVIYCEVLNATDRNAELSQQVIAIVKKWGFGKIDKPGDITEAIYPLVFSM